MYVCMYVCMCVCVYIYIYIYIYDLVPNTVYMVGFQRFVFRNFFQTPGL